MLLLLFFAASVFIGCSCMALSTGQCHRGGNRLLSREEAALPSEHGDGGRSQLPNSEGVDPDARSRARERATAAHRSVERSVRAAAQVALTKARGHSSRQAVPQAEPALTEEYEI